MSQWRRTITSLFFLLPLYLITGLALVVAYLSLFLDPARFAVPAFCGLYLWAIVALNLALLVLGLLRRSKLTWIPFLALLPMLVFAGRFVRYDANARQPQGDFLRILTYNVFNFDHLDGSPRNLAESYRHLAQYCEAGDLDILCFQEFSTLDTLALSSAFRAWPYHHYYFPRFNRQHYYGNVILSKYPLSRPHNLLFEGGNKCCISVDVHLGGDVRQKADLRLFNVHLQSTSVSLIDVGNNFYTKGADLQVEEGIKRAHRHMRTAFENRSNQIGQIRALLAHTEGPRVLCGDFNDTPFSYVYQQIKSAGMEDSFTSSGHGWGATYRFLYPLLRIDYLFHDPAWVARRQEIPHWPFSDHYPVITYLQPPCLTK